MKKMLFVSLVLAAGLVALAPPARAESAVQVEKSATAAASRGLWMEFKLGAFAGYSGMMVVSSAPGFVIGYKLGRVVLAAELGVQYSRADSDGTNGTWDYRSVGVSVLPQVQVHVLERGPVALYVLGGAGVGYSHWRYPSMSDQTSDGFSVLVQVGFGARYFLHPRFALGAELGAGARYSRSDETYDGGSTETKGWSAGLSGALTAAVVF